MQALGITSLREFLVCKVCISNKTDYVLAICRSSSQIYLELQTLLSSFDTLFQKWRVCHVKKKMLKANILLRETSLLILRRFLKLY